MKRKREQTMSTPKCPGCVICLECSHELMMGLIADRVESLKKEIEKYLWGCLQNMERLEKSKIQADQEDYAMNCGYAGGYGAALRWIDEAFAPLINKEEVKK